VVLLAWRAGEPVGLAIAFEGYSTFAARPLLNLHDLVVAAEHRGRGAGGRLLDAVEGEARSRGCAFVTLEVVGSNRAAQRLYRRHGFVGGESISPPEAVMFFKKPLQ
ncbi:MAG: GNAT family N-acetyltransferase, partial [Planctomycetota bacterium]